MSNYSDDLFADDEIQEISDFSIPPPTASEGITNNDSVMLLENAPTVANSSPTKLAIDPYGFLMNMALAVANNGGASTKLQSPETQRLTLELFQRIMKARTASQNVPFPTFPVLPLNEGVPKNNHIYVRDSHAELREKRVAIGTQFEPKQNPPPPGSKLNHSRRKESQNRIHDYDWYDSFPIRKSWVAGSGRSNPITIRYNHKGELDTKIQFNARTLKLYIQGCRQNGISLRLWVQHPATMHKDRFPTDTSHRCRFVDCPLANRTINRGMFQVSLDEYPAETSNGRYDPFYVAGYFHLHCMERMISMAKLMEVTDVQPDVRDLPLESKNPMSLDRDDPRLLLPTYNEWKAMHYDSLVQCGLPIHATSFACFEETLVHHLTYKKVTMEPKTRKEVRLKRVEARANKVMKKFGKAEQIPEQESEGDEAEKAEKEEQLRKDLTTNIASHRGNLVEYVEARVTMRKRMKTGEVNGQQDAKSEGEDAIEDEIFVDIDPVAAPPSKRQRTNSATSAAQPGPRRSPRTIQRARAAQKAAAAAAAQRAVARQSAARRSANQQAAVYEMPSYQMPAYHMPVYQMPITTQNFTSDQDDIFGWPNALGDGQQDIADFGQVYASNMQLQPPPQFVSDYPSPYDLNTPARQSNLEVGWSDFSEFMNEEQQLQLLQQECEDTQPMQPVELAEPEPAEAPRPVTPDNLIDPSLIYQDSASVVSAAPAVPQDNVQATTDWADASIEVPSEDNSGDYFSDNFGDYSSMDVYPIFENQD